MYETVPVSVKEFVQIKVFSVEGSVKITKYNLTLLVSSLFF